MFKAEKESKSFKNPPNPHYTQVSRILLRSHSPELGHEATLNWESGEQDCCDWLRSLVIQAMGLPGCGYLSLQMLLLLYLGDGACGCDF